MGATSHATFRQPNLNRLYVGDRWLLIVSLLLVAFGLVMMTSASIEIAESDFNDTFYHLKRQLRFLIIGLVAAVIVGFIPLKYWYQFSPILLVAAYGLLILVLVPGVGHKVNGSTRWLDLGLLTIQASEPAKLFVIIFIAWYLSRYREFVCSSWKGFMLPFALLAIPALLLLLEPDFGAVVVMMIAVFGMMFLAGVKVYQFLLVIVAAVGGAGALLFTSSYRWARVQSYIQALSDPFNEDVVYGSGYQLAQALIAFGRGEWFGVGLGNSIQKMYFLPEAHTDFVLAIIAEELGLVGVLILLAVFLVFIARAMLIARKNENNKNFFAAYMGYGISFLFLGQVVINSAVNIGLLPTKGLTLPFLSYGGSSLIICLVMVAMLLRIDIENHYNTSVKTPQDAYSRFRSG